MTPQGPISSLSSLKTPYYTLLGHQKSKRLGGIYQQDEHKTVIPCIHCNLTTWQLQQIHSTGVKCLLSAQRRLCVKKMSNPRPVSSGTYHNLQGVHHLWTDSDNPPPPELSCPGVRLVISRLTNPTKNLQETLLDPCHVRPTDFFHLTTFMQCWEHHNAENIATARTSPSI